MSGRDVTRLLHDWQEGRQEALDELMPLVYDELHRLARRHMKPEKKGHTLQTTALVHEAYLRLLGAEVPWKDRVHFFAVAARCMRRILVDHARARDSAKRGGKAVKVPLDEAIATPVDPGLNLVVLDGALSELETQDERKGKVVEMHYFAGLEIEEIASLLGVSASTVKSDLRFARAWLRSRLEA